MVLPGNKKFIEGACFRAPARAAEEEAPEQAKATARMRSASCSAAMSSSTCFWTIWNCPTSPSASSRRRRSEASPRRLYQFPGHLCEYFGEPHRAAGAGEAGGVAASAAGDDRATEVELAECDEARREELMLELTALKAKFRRIPFIDPIDIRYRRFETVRLPVAQAVMFCLMTSGSRSSGGDPQRFYAALMFPTLAAVITSRSSSSVIPIGLRKSMRTPFFAVRHPAARWYRARCRRCNRSSGRGFAPRTGHLRRLCL